MTKLTSNILQKLKELAQKRYNHTEIGDILGFKRQTIDYWVKKHNIPTNKNRSKEQYERYLKFKKICEEAYVNKTTIKLNQTLRELNLHPDSAQRILNDNPALRIVIRSKQQAIVEDKTLSLEEAQSRLPSQDDRIIGFEDGRYTIITQDGFTYYKTSAKLYQGDPRGKSGTTRNVEDIKVKLNEIGYTLLEESYVIKRESLRAIHRECGNIRTNRFSNFFKQGCPTCSNTGTSKDEEEVNQWVKSLGFTTEKFRFKGKTKGKEIDIYIPSLNLGIEYCGLYWHSEGNFKSRNYHYDKMKQANEQGIRLITIFEDEWKYRQKQVKNFLKSVLGAPGTRIYARKCSVEEVCKDVGKGFLEDNHIQGKANFKAAFGLYYDSVLVGLVTGSNHHRQDKNSFVLNRLVFKDGVQVVGGASRLLKYLTKYAQDNGYRQLISWSDNRWSEGNVYEKCGFRLENYLNPDYSYIVPKSGVRQSKQSNKKALLLKKGAIGSMDNTERELALTLGYYRIWDCGKKRWVMDLINPIPCL